jgi:alpha-beta hydrolase superfamily lysophospholipase
MDFESRENYQVPLLWQILMEATGILDLSKLVVGLPELLTSSKGTGETILFIPGFGTSDTITFPFRNFLSFLGYDVHGWGLGLNTGNVPRLLPRVSKLVKELAEKKNQKIILIGWSLGGYLAREAARDYPKYVKMVVTLGSPVIGGPKYTSMKDIYLLNGVDTDHLEKEIDKRYRVPIEVPMLALYSKQDNIVSWQACIDSYSPRIRHIKVSTTHIGLIYSFETFSLVAKALSGEVQL